MIFYKNKQKKDEESLYIVKNEKNSQTKEGCEFFILVFRYIPQSAVLIGRDAKAFFVRAVKGGIFPKAATLASAGNALPFPNQTSRQKQPLDQNVIPQGRAGRFFKTAGQLRFGQIEIRGDRIQGKLLGQVLIHKLDDLEYFPKFLALHKGMLFNHVLIAGLNEKRIEKSRNRHTDPIRRGIIPKLQNGRQEPLQRTETEHVSRTQSSLAEGYGKLPVELSFSHKEKWHLRMASDILR